MATADTAIAEKNTSADTAGHILNETWDLLESPVWKEVERDCLDASFDTLRDGSYNTNAPMEEGTAGRNMGWSKLFTPKSQAGHSSWNGGGDNGPQGVGDDGGVEEAVPLAYVLTQLKKVTQTSFYNQVSTRDAFRGGRAIGVRADAAEEGNADVVLQPGFHARRVPWRCAFARGHDENNVLSKCVRAGD